MDLHVDDGFIRKLEEIFLDATLKGSYRIWVNANKKQAARWAQVEIRGTAVTMVRPRKGATAFVLDSE